MDPTVKSKRQYNSVRRREQAAVTRQEILEAARRLFEQEGYDATTMAAIAKEAGTAYKTLYLAFETKSSILRSLWNQLLRGNPESEAPVADQPWYLEAINDPDPERQLRLNARNSRQGKERIATTVKIIRSAAPTDPDIHALWQRIQTEYRKNQMVLLESVAAKAALKKSLSIDKAADILWTINHPDVWQLLVDERGWTADEYEQWCGDTACAQLLRQSRDET